MEYIEIDYRKKTRKLYDGSIVQIIGTTVFVITHKHDWTTTGVSWSERVPMRLPLKLFKDVRLDGMKKGYFKVVL